MRREKLCVCGLASLTIFAGCGVARTISGRLGARQVRVLLVNNGDFPVDVRIRYDDEQDIVEDLLDEIGTELTFTIEAGGGTRSFTRDCGSCRPSASSGLTWT